MIPSATLSQDSIHSNTLSILLQDGSVNIYDEQVSGEVLSTFNAAVRGCLFKVGKNFELEPNLISKWTWNSNDNSYNLKLDEKIKFHDGTRPNSEDLEFTLLRGFFTKKKTYYEIFLGNIKGATDIAQGTKYQPGLVPGVKVLDASSVQVFLTSPNPSFLYSLTQTFFSLTSQRFYNDDLMTFKKWPIGAGPFKVTSEDEYMVTLKCQSANSSQIFDTINFYKKKKPGVVYDVSFLPGVISNEHTAYTDDPDSIRTIFFNQTNPLSKNENFRKSIFFGIQKEKLVIDKLKSSVAESFLVSSFWMKKSQVSNYDLAKAREYFSKIPKELIKSYKIPVYESSKSFSVEKQQFCDELARQLKDIGFRFEFQPSSEKLLSLETAINSPFRISSRVADSMDPLLMFGSFLTDSAYKYDNAQNDKNFDILYDIAARSQGTDDRVKTLQDLSHYTIQNIFFIPLTENRNVYYFNPKTVKTLGRQPNPIALNLDSIELK